MGIIGYEGKPGYIGYAPAVGHPLDFNWRTAVDSNPGWNNRWAPLFHLARVHRWAQPDNTGRYLIEVWEVLQESLDTARGDSR